MKLKPGLMNNNAVFKLIVGFFVLLIALFVSIAYGSGKEITESPKVDWVSHTEYWTSAGIGENESASTIVRITDYRGEPFDITSCKVTILYPNKTVYVENQSLSASGVAGNWYAQTRIPDATGTYEQKVACLYSGGKTLATAQSFHVNPALEYLKSLGSGISAESGRSIALGDALRDVNLTFSASVSNSTGAILVRINQSQQSLASLLGALDSSVSQQVRALNYSGEISSVNLSLNAAIAGQGERLALEIRNASYNLTSLNSQLRSDLFTRLDAMNGTLAGLSAAVSGVDSRLGGLNSSVESIRTDLQWISSNAMNSGDMAGIMARFDRLQANISALNASLANACASNASGICQSVNLSSLEQGIQALRDEQLRFNESQSNAISALSVLSADIAVKIDGIILRLDDLLGLATQINQTVAGIREDQASQVDIRVIS